MQGINEATVMGTVTRSTGLRATRKGMPVCNLSVATEEAHTDGDGERKVNVEYHEIICFSKLAELCASRPMQGRRVMVRGPMKLNEWERDGQKRRRTEIIATSLWFMDGD